MQTIQQPPLATVQYHCLVIGYGNELRGDDGVGRLLAEQLEAWALPGVEVRSVRQLTPELAAEIAQAQQVVFLDAEAVPNQGVRWQRIIPQETPALIGHHATPAQLLQLTSMLYGVSPAAWLVALPVAHFGLGEPLSEQALHGAKLALHLLREWLLREPGLTSRSM